LLPGEPAGGGRAAGLEVRTVSGAVHTVPAISWRLGWPIELPPAGGKPTKIESADLDRILTGRPRVTPAGPWRVQTREGDSIHAEIKGGEEERLLVGHPRLGTRTLGIEHLSRIVRSVEGGTLPDRGDEDVILHTGGERLAGSVVRFSSTHVVLFDGSDERSVAWTAVRAILFAVPGRAAHDGLSALVELTDGTCLAARKLSWQGNALRLELTCGGSAELERGDVAAVEIRGGRRTWLSELPPARYESIPWMEKTWPFRVDQSVVGGPLAVGGRVYRRGLGLHAACSISWDLGGRYERFRCLVGMDESAGDLADSDVRVFIDDRESAAIPRLAAGGEAVPIEVDVRGAKQLRFEVGFGGGGHVQDRVNLLEPALILP
jgi:hypothetical protein